MRIRVAAALGFYRGDAGRYEYCAEFVRLLQEAPCRPTRRNLSLRQNLEPEGGFVRLLQRAVDARDELRSEIWRDTSLCSRRRRWFPIDGADRRYRDIRPSPAAFVRTRGHPGQTSSCLP